MDESQVAIVYGVYWAVASLMVLGVVFVCGSMLELDPGSIVGLLWRSAMTGAVFVGAGVLVGMLPLMIPMLGFAVQTGALMLCAFVLFRVGFPEEWVYALAFALGIQIGVMFVMFGVGILIDFNTPKP